MGWVNCIGLDWYRPVFLFWVFFDWFRSSDFLSLFFWVFWISSAFHPGYVYILIPLLTYLLKRCIICYCWSSLHLISWFILLVFFFFLSKLLCVIDPILHATLLTFPHTLYKYSFYSKIKKEVELLLYYTICSWWFNFAHGRDRSSLPTLP